MVDAKGNTPLHIAAKDGSVELAELTLMHGADTMVTNNQGQNPLFLAAEHKHPDVVRCLQAHWKAHGRGPSPTEMQA